MSAPPEIVGLVQRFEEQLEAYQSGRYNETQLRREFVDPMFKALGWDMENISGYAEAYKDVIHEDAIKIGGATKAPDYCFRIGGTRKFFLETKKPSVDIKTDAQPAYQLRRYAWSAKLPLSVLTDFEEFAVYDCRVEPRLDDKASVARVLYLNFREYAERWDDVAKIFAREAILKGSFDKFAESAKAKRGTAEVDDAFLGEIERWRADLARNLALRNPTLGQRDLNFAVQRTIDRIVFLRICEDRRIEGYGRLLALLNGERIYARVYQLFRQADERYNSGLFHFHKEKDRAEAPDELTPNLEIDDAVLKKIIRRLYYPESPYEFSVLPADILGQVYEQFLGKVIRLTEGHQAKIEEKPEVKKAGGVYYTPTYIVDYIVKNAVGKLLENKTPKQAAKLRIVDPACGSGSFLIGAYQYLLDWHRDWYVADDPKKWATGRKSALYRGMGGEWKLTTAERKRILLQNIFGVDIDAQAVEVTKLSLLLKVLEGESEETLATQLRFYHERALPDLGRNIKCGNSLIGPDFYEQQEMALLDEEERYRVNVFDWNVEFPEIMKSGGFDAVIGNPPYLAGREWTESLWNQRPYFLSHYSCMTDQYDLYALFIQKAISLTNEDGRFGFITPTTWLNNEHYIQLRRWLVQNSQVSLLGDYRQIKVFPKATVLPIVIIATRKLRSRKTALCLVDIFSSPTIRTSLKTSPAIWDQFPDLIFNLSISERDVPIMKKIETVSQRLGSFCDVRFGVKVYQRGKGDPRQTEAEAKNRLFEASRKKGPDYYEYLWGSHVTPWHIQSGGTFLKYGPHLAEPRTFEMFTGKRILVRRIVGKKLIVAPTDKTFVADQLLHTVKPQTAFPDYRLIAAFLGSRAIAYYFRKRFNRTEKTFPEIRVAELAALPVRKFDPADKGRHDRIVSAVERMLDLNKELAAATTEHAKTNLQRQIDATDAQIDQLVYELYELIPDEIKIVEESITAGTAKNTKGTEAGRLPS